MIVNINVIQLFIAVMIQKHPRIEIVTFVTITQIVSIHVYVIVFAKIRHKQHKVIDYVRYLSIWMDLCGMNGMLLIFATTAKHLA